MSNGPAPDRWFDGRVRLVVEVRRDVSLGHGHGYAMRVETLECGHGYVPSFRPGCSGAPPQYRVCWECQRSEQAVAR